MAVASPTRSDGWLFGPLPDLLFGCGVLYAIVFAAYSLAGPSIRGVTPSYALPFLSLLLSSPHYGATLVRVYDQRSERQAYAVFALWLTLALVVLFFAALRSTWLASLLLTLYLTWSPWHYTGQNYGLGVMFLRRRGVNVTPIAKRWLHAAFILSFLITATVMHLAVGPAYSALAYTSEVVTFVPIGIPRGVGDAVLPILGAGYVVSLVVSGVLLRRAASWRDLVPTFVLVLTQALWFSLPFSVHYLRWQTGLEPIDAQHRIGDYLLLIAVFHGLQYLWVTTYYARASGHWDGYASYWTKAAAAGVAIWTLPAVLLDPGGLVTSSGRAHVMLVIATFVNLHHFILDGAIWKLRHSRIASVLIRSVPDEESGIAARSGWLRRLLWSGVGVGLAAGALGFYVSQVYVPEAITRGDLDRADGGVALARWLGADEAALRDQLAERWMKAGQFSHAAPHVERLVSLRPDSESYALLGLVEMARGRPEAARAAFDTSLAKGKPPVARVRVGLARIALQRGNDVLAAENYREAIQLQPASAAIANELARLLATSDDAAVRDVPGAIAAAERLVSIDEQPDHLDTLAAAYAAGGRFENAVQTASRAVELAELERNQSRLADIRRNLDRYRAHQTAAR